jgi:hypothetical protein
MSSGDDKSKSSSIERVGHVRDNPRFKSAHAHRCNPQLEAIFDGLGDGEMTWKEWRQKSWPVHEMHDVVAQRMSSSLALCLCQSERVVEEDDRRMKGRGLS